MEPVPRTNPKPFISLCRISKHFGSVVANRDISLDFFEGEIHAIIGENGAGKSTLMQILSGELQPDTGTILLNGRTVTLANPREAMRAGIGMAHQNFLIFPQLTALENIVVGCEPGVRGWLNRKRAAEESEGLCQSVGFDLPLEAPAMRLSFAHRQQIEILRLLYRKVRVLILDEPTSLLAPPETERLLNLLRSLQADGYTILFISHRMHEVLALADRVSVLRRGRGVGTYHKAEINRDFLVRLVVSGGESHPAEGTDATAAPEKDRKPRPSSPVPGLIAALPHRQPIIRNPQSSTPILRIRGVTTRTDFREAALQDLSLEVAEGEVFGVGGVVGNGQRALAMLVAGILPTAEGTVLLGSREIGALSVRERMAAGLRWLPANPGEEALLPSRSLWENLLLGRQRQPPWQRHGWLRKRAMKIRATEELDRNEVVYAWVSDPLAGLSGGNAQKLALSRVLTGLPRLVILEQPTRGLDLRAQELLHRRIRELNGGGVTFLLISYDLDELLALSHRIGILFGGRLMGVAKPSDASRELLGSWMLGVSTGEGKPSP